MSTTPKTCMPTRQQTLLLKASLLKGNEAVDAWKSWQKETTFTNIDYGSLRLIPLLYHNMLACNQQNQIPARYKGIFRRFWSSNHLLFHHVKPVIAALHRAGIEVLLFKGAGLVLSCKLNYALRPMDDIDFLVRKDKAREAVEIIKNLSWKPKISFAGEVDPGKHAVMYHDGQGHVIDMHWQSLIQVSSGKTDAGYWQRSSETDFEGIPVRVMSTTDQLFHTIVHGFQWNPIPPIRWAADTSFLIQASSHPVDWDFLVEHAAATHTSRSVFQALTFIKTELHTPVPEKTLHELKQIPVTFRAKWHYHFLIHKPVPVFGNFLLKVMHFLVYDQKNYPFPSFLRFLQNIWQVKSPWLVPLEGLLRMWRKVKIDLFKYNPASLPMSTVFQKKDVH